MVRKKRMEEIRRVLSKAIYGKTYRNLTEKQAINVGKKTLRVVKKERKKK
jgi:hypothetical protein|tara:strand:+ start:1495 stop:1644 length:150 start_codon:yes stop_codon:yes gene_type:complete